ncbi:MAG: DPP IV N-terminal domain-containing protein [Sphingomonadaceae bacterium]|nr:DPP IV N-terminal domain-containing protein [Sphingomonadaceae bacterium]
MGRTGLLAALALAVLSVPAGAAELTLERIFASPSLSGPTPRALKLSPDGRLATLLKPRPDDRDRYDLWAVDVATGASRMLVDSTKLAGGPLSEAERMNRERQRIAAIKGIASYDWAPDGKALLVPVDGALWLATLDGSVRKLAADASEAQLSPKGRFASFVRDRNLHVLDLGDGRETALTCDGSDTVGWGAAEFIAQEELHRFTGLWWSPTDARLAVERADESGVKVVQRAAIGADGTRVYAQRYPAAGTPNAVVELWLMDPDGGHRVKADLGPDPDIYLARVDWAADGHALYVQRLSRDQKRLDLLQVDPATGAAQVIYHETSPTWINLDDDFRALKDGSLILGSERTGFHHLYRLADGTLTPVIGGHWAVDGLAGIDETTHTLFFTGYADTVLEKHLYAADYLAPAAPCATDARDPAACLPPAPRRLTEPGGWHEVTMDKGGTAALVTRQTPAQPPQTYLADATGKRRAWIEENRLDASHPYAPYLAQHIAPVFGTISAADDTPLHYRLFLPPTPGRHPVYFTVYGGPAVQSVARTWAPPVIQLLLQRGWAVFQLDNRGATHRGKAFEDVLYRAMGRTEVEDQLAALKWVKAQPWAAADKVVVNGWSYGGYMTLKLLEGAPHAFAAGIAGAPVTRWELYDTAYTERYLGKPPSAAYTSSDALGDAAKIADPLLLIHGMADDNVVFENSTALMNALQHANKPFDLMVYPGATHAAEATLGVHVWQTRLRFMARIAPTGY